MAAVRNRARECDRMPLDALWLQPRARIAPALLALSLSLLWLLSMTLTPARCIYVTRSLPFL